MATIPRFHLILSKALSTPACAPACAELMCSFLDRYPTLDAQDDSIQTGPTRCKRLLLHVVQATYDKLLPLLEEVEAQKKSWWSLGPLSFKSSPSSGPHLRKKNMSCGLSKNEKGGKRNNNRDIHVKFVEGDGRREISIFLRTLKIHPRLGKLYATNFDGASSTSPHYQHFVQHDFQHSTFSHYDEQ